MHWHHCPLPESTIYHRLRCFNAVQGFMLNLLSTKQGNMLFSSRVMRHTCTSQGQVIIICKKFIISMPLLQAYCLESREDCY